MAEDYDYNEFEDNYGDDVLEGGNFDAKDLFSKDKLPKTIFFGLIILVVILVIIAIISGATKKKKEGFNTARISK